MSKKIFLKPLKAIASPGIYLFYKFNQFKRERREQSKRRITEKQLSELNHKIDKLLNKLDDKDGEIASQADEECVICITAKAVMQTYPCGHKVVCRKCFLKTIQSALSQRSLPLKCVLCRSKVLRLKRSPGRKCQRRLPNKIIVFNHNNNNNNNNSYNAGHSASSGVGSAGHHYTKWRQNAIAGSMGGKTWVVPNMASRHPLQQQICTGHDRISSTSNAVHFTKSNLNFNSRRAGCDAARNKSCLQEIIESSVVPSSSIRRRTIRSAGNNKNNNTEKIIGDNVEQDNSVNNNNNNTDNNKISDSCKSENAIGTTISSRQELIRKFQRDFREGKQSSSSCSSTKTVPTNRYPEKITAKRK